MELYDYQIKVAELIQSGQSVILQAPTGAGKTIAALWPYLESWGSQRTYCVSTKMYLFSSNESIGKSVCVSNR